MGFRATVLTLFPEMFPGPLGSSLAGRALRDGIWTLAVADIRASASDRHRSVDDTPAGGGPGMVMRPDVLAAAIDAACPEGDERPRLLMSARGIPLGEARVRGLAGGPGVVLVAGRFEGVDERVIAARRLTEVSIGDYILSGGEIAAMVVLDAVVRLLPGVPRISALHAPGRMGGPADPADPSVGRPRAHCRLAARAGGGTHPRAAARPDRAP
jgi:tRNA (guanine37-N1)-methyltransferase